MILVSGMQVHVHTHSCARQFSIKEYSVMELIVTIVTLKVMSVLLAKVREDRFTSGAEKQLNIHEV